MLRKRSFKLAGHATSLALEPEFWATLGDMAVASGRSMAAVIAAIDARRSASPLASACRVAALAWTKANPNGDPETRATTAASGRA